MELLFFLSLSTPEVDNKWSCWCYEYSWANVCAAISREEQKPSTNINRDTLEQMTTFIYLGHMTPWDGNCGIEINKEEKKKKHTKYERLKEFSIEWKSSYLETCNTTDEVLCVFHTRLWCSGMDIKWENVNTNWGTWNGDLQKTRVNSTENKQTRVNSMKNEN